MATLIPALNSCRGMTAGERRFAERLERKLEGDYLLWYDVAVGSAGFHPDFIILHPRRGLAVFEVKDWKIDSIQAIDKHRVSLITPRGLVSGVQPYEQARGYAHAITNRLEHDPALVGLAGTKYQGKLLFPWTYGVVLTNITRNQFDEHELGNVIPETRVICKDEMTETVDPLEFQQRIWEMFQVEFQCLLTLPQVDRIRYHLFPEIRIERAAQPDLFIEVQPKIPDIIRIMDIQQEQLARSLGDGHRVIHGVAGSGKTMILGYRCLQLAKIMAKPILVLCFNRALANRLEGLYASHNLSAKVSARTFHGWCLDQLDLFHVPRPPSGPNFFDEAVQAVIQAVDRSQIPAGQYGALLIDEGHDFQPEWLKLIAQMVDPETNSLLVLYDDAQSIYNRSRKKKISFKQLGIQAQGRTTILRLNYRNTAEVLSVAYAFAQHVLSPEDADDDGVPIIRPESAERHGAKPVIVELPKFSDEIKHVVSRFRDLAAKGRKWSDMAIIYRTDFMGDEARQQLTGAGIPCSFLKEERSPQALQSDSVKIVTMHASKGLEFPVVAIPGIGYMPKDGQDEQEETRLLYVGMTRAMDELVLTCHKRNGFVERLSQAIAAA
jgi:hypothetical protein